MYSYKDRQSGSNLSRNIAIVCLFVGGGYFAWLFDLVPRNVLNLASLSALSSSDEQADVENGDGDPATDPAVFEQQIEPDPLASGEDMDSLSLILAGNEQEVYEDRREQFLPDYQTEDEVNAGWNSETSDPPVLAQGSQEFPVNGMTMATQSNSQPSGRHISFHVDPAVQKADYNEHNHADSPVQTASATRTLTYNQKRDRVKLQNVPYRNQDNIQLLSGHSEASIPASSQTHREPAHLPNHQLTKPVIRPMEKVEANQVPPEQEIARHRELSTKYWKEPHNRAAIRKEIDRLASKIYFQKTAHYLPTYEVQPGDQLRLIAQKYGVPWQYLARLNRVTPEKIRVGDKLKVIKGPFSAVVDLSDYELTVHSYGFFVCRFPIGVGRNGSTPTGKFKVLNKEENPVYYGDGEIIGRDDPKNPLGERWIDLGDSYGIHGTIDPNSIGKAESKGCIRLKNAQVEILYDLLSVGSEVVIKP